MHRLLDHDTLATDSPGYVRGGFGGEMDFACFSIASYFGALPGWGESRVDPHEVIYLAGFFAFIALVSSPSAPFGLAEAATGAKATVARTLMARGAPPAVLTQRINLFKRRLNRYSALWVGVLRGENSFGAFSKRVFENLQAEDRTWQGYVEHVNGFPDFCERRIRAFHAAALRDGVSSI